MTQTPNTAGQAHGKPLQDFLITRKWPARHPERIQLYSLTTPNGAKVSIALEELGLPYEAHRIDITANDQFTAEFLSLNPNNKIPAILDPDGPGGQPLALFESGAILIYLAEKTGRLLPQDGAQRYQALQWLMWQMGGLGPMFGQLGFFYKYAGREIEDPRPRERYANESRRLLGVLDQQLQERDWLLGRGEAAYSIADIAIFPWVRNLVVGYGAAELVGFEQFKHVQRVLAAFNERPAVQRGLLVPAAGEQP
ncbi:glutathione S-transferase N-terminal domain-containing protein [Vandammella animalimorsus]|uniref:Glutathione S-transferase n=1 Tax=Vandammella animalimorsus TaxID=2029117 RepID=A0A2A2B0V9_9BURK|nr:glutathione S-transferase N-terminal domain-containing protein [Vandammella animalimorsus]PAT43717.1 glutathione S-transferase [Vandammella animalimorsus]